MRRNQPAGKQHFDGPPVIVLAAAIAREPLQEALVPGHTLPCEFVEEFEALDEFEFLRRHPGAGFSGHVIEFGPGLQGFRQPKTPGHGFNDQGAAWIGLEIVDWGQEVRVHRTQSFGAIQSRLNVVVGLVREADDERKMPRDAVPEHLLRSLVYLFDLDVLANTLQYLVGAGFDADEQPP